MGKTVQNQGDWMPRGHSGHLEGIPHTFSATHKNVPGRTTRIPLASGELSPRAKTREPMRSNESSRVTKQRSLMSQQRPDAAR